jgi:cytochrome P450
MPKSADEILAGLDLFDPEQSENMTAALARARTSCPVLRSEADGGYYLLTRYDDVRSVCERPEDFSNADPALRGKPAGVRLIPLDADPPLHRDFRRLLNPFFTRTYVTRYEPRIREIARNLIEPLLEQEEFDFVYQYAVPLTAGVLSNMIFVNETPEFMSKAVANVERVAAELSVEAFTELGMMAAEALTRSEARGDSADDEADGTVLGMLNKGTIDGGRPLDFGERLGIVAALLSGGLDTTRSAMANIAEHLATRPDIEARLRDPKWIKTDLDEFLRIQPTVSFMARTAIHDTIVGDQKFVAGDRVVLSYLSANRDAARFEQPDELAFGLDRKASAAFGLGIHRCLGSHLATLQIEVAFDELLKRMTNLRVRPGAEIHRAVGISIGTPEHLPLQFDKL